MTNPLTPTARLVLFSLRETPDQTFAGLLVSTGTRNKDTMYQSLRLLEVAGLIGHSAKRPATYALIQTEEVPRG
jgi:hypothetical protein